MTNPRTTGGWTTGYRGFPPGVSAAILRRDPICRACGAAPSTQADHILPHAEGGSDHMSNGQGLCTPCHDAKTRTEQARGRARRSLHRPRPPHPGLTD